MVTTSVPWLSDVLDDAVFSIETDPIDLLLIVPLGQYSVVQQTETGESTQIDSIVVLDKGR